MNTKQLYATIKQLEDHFGSGNVKTIRDLREFAEDNNIRNGVDRLLYAFTVKTELENLIPQTKNNPRLSKIEFKNKLRLRVSGTIFTFNAHREAYLLPYPDVLVLEIVQALEIAVLNGWYQSKTYRPKKVDVKGLERVEKIERLYWEGVTANGTPGKESKDHPTLGKGRLYVKDNYIVFINTTRTEFVQIGFYENRLVRYEIAEDVKPKVGKEVLNLKGSVTTITLTQMKEALNKIQHLSNDETIKGFCKFVVQVI